MPTASTSAPAAANSMCARMQAPGWLVKLTLGAVVVALTVLILMYVYHMFSSLRRQQIEASMWRENFYEEISSAAAAASAAAQQPARPAKFVYIYMNGCPHCVAFDKTWSEVEAWVAAKYPTQLETVKMVNTDPATAQFEAKGFPYIAFVPASGQPPKQYTGSRKLSDVQEFLAREMMTA